MRLIDRPLPLELKIQLILDRLHHRFTGIFGVLRLARRPSESAAAASRSPRIIGIFEHLLAPDLERRCACPRGASADSCDCVAFASAMPQSGPTTRHSTPTEPAHLMVHGIASGIRAALGRCRRHARLSRRRRPHPPGRHPRHRDRSRTVLMKLLTRHLRPLSALLVADVFSSRSPIASLYLPTLNADIIDDGVAKGDTGYILRRPAASMLAVTPRAGRLRRSSRSTSARASRWAFGRDVRGRPVPPRRSSSRQREVGQFGAPSLITRNTNDVQQVQMLVLMTCTHDRSPRRSCAIGGIIMALREDVGAVVAAARRVPVLLVSVGLIIGADGAAVPRDAGAIDRSTGCCASRSPASAWSARSCASRDEARALRRRERRPHGDTALRVGKLHGADVPDRHARVQRVERRGALVRRVTASTDGAHARSAR